MIARTAVTVAFAAATGVGGAQTKDAAKKNYTGSAIITSLSLNAPDGESVTYSISLEGTG